MSPSSSSSGEHPNESKPIRVSPEHAQAIPPRNWMVRNASQFVREVMANNPIHQQGNNLRTVIADPRVAQQPLQPRAEDFYPTEAITPQLREQFTAVPLQNLLSEAEPADADVARWPEQLADAAVQKAVQTPAASAETYTDVATRLVASPAAEAAPVVATASVQSVQPAVSATADANLNQADIARANVARALDSALGVQTAPVVIAEERLTQQPLAAPVVDAQALAGRMMAKAGIGGQG